MRLTGVRTNIITGQPDAKRRVIERLLALRPDGERWALLDNDVLAGGWLQGRPEADLHVATLPEGCMCCAAQVELRVALTRLLREAMPERLLLLPSAQAELVQIRRLLSDRWLSPVLVLNANIHAVDRGDFPGHERPGAMAARGPMAAADVLLLANDIDVPLAGLPPQARVVGMDALNVALLDAPGRKVGGLFSA